MRKPNKKRAVIVVCDSLRTDLIYEKTAPTLMGLKADAAQFLQVQGLFPSVTRVCAASMATGCWPVRHGLLGNTMVIDEGAGLVCLSVGNPDFVERLRSATGRTLHRPTLAQRLVRLGGCIVMSNVSAGAAYFHDPDGYGYVYHRAGSFGPGRIPLTNGLDIKIGAEGDMAMTERFCTEVLQERAPALAVLWLSEPDHTGHHTPLGSPGHRAAIGSADRCVRKVLDTVSRLDPGGENIFWVVCSDHGMETVRRVIDIGALLVKAGYKDADDSNDVVVAPQGFSALIHFSSEAQERIAAVARWFSSQDFTGCVIAMDQLASLGLPFGNSLGLAITLKYESRVNDFGVEGYCDAAANPFSFETTPGFGQHGGLGRHEKSPFLFVRYPEIAPGNHMRPVSLVDIAPTVLRHLGLPCDGMDGQPL